MFQETFDTQEAFDSWTIVDNNGGRTWEFLNGTAAYMLDYQTGLPGDDYYISPEFELNADNVYELTFYMGVVPRGPKTCASCWAPAPTPHRLPKYSPISPA